jgi:hypothetical protein
MQKLRWKALVVRGETLHCLRVVCSMCAVTLPSGEEQVAVPPNTQLSSIRQLPFQFEELPPPSGMSVLAEVIVPLVLWA